MWWEERETKKERTCYVKHFEILNSAAAAAADIIAAVTAATAIAVPDIHSKMYQIVGKINILNILLKLFSEDVFSVRSKTRNKSIFLL